MCPTPVYVLVFTCRRPGSRNLRKRPARPAPSAVIPATFLSDPHPVRGGRQRARPAGASRELVAQPGVQAEPAGRVFPSPRVPAGPRNVRGSVRTAAAARPVSSRVASLPRLCPRPGVRTLSTQPLPPLSRESSLAVSGLRLFGRQELLHLASPPHSPSATCAAVPTPARFRLQCSPSSPPAPQPAPGSRLRTPGSRWPGREEWGGAAEAAPPTLGGEWSAQHPLAAYLVPSPALTRLWQGLPLWFLTSRITKCGFRHGEANYLAALATLATGLYCQPPPLYKEPSQLPSPDLGKPPGSRQRRLGFHPNRPRPLAHTSAWPAKQRQYLLPLEWVLPR